MIYFLQCQGFVKIGYTNTASVDGVRSRIRMFDIGNPFQISVLGVMAGDQSFEYSLHRRFNSLKIKGEWFALSEDLAAFIKTEAISPEELGDRTRACRMCSEQFLPTTTEDCCSVSCSNRKRCAVCQQAFYPSKKNAVYCSSQCYHQMMSTMSAARISR